LQGKDLCLIETEQKMYFKIFHMLTGYIPGMNFRYGKSFQRAADDSVMELNRRMSQEEMRREKERSHRSQSAPKMPSIRSKDEVKKTLHHYQNRRYGGRYSQQKTCHSNINLTFRHRIG
jgi:hypothetical protein